MRFLLAFWPPLTALGLAVAGGWRCARGRSSVATARTLIILAVFILGCWLALAAVVWAALRLVGLLGVVV